MRFFERATVVVLALVLVGYLNYDMEKIAASSPAPIFSGHQLHKNTAL